PSRYARVPAVQLIVALAPATRTRTNPSAAAYLLLSVGVVVVVLMLLLLLLQGHHAWLARLEKRVGWLHAFNITVMCLVVLFVIQYNNVDPSTPHPLSTTTPVAPSPPPLPVG